jgi:DNA-binding transcriptional MocR family regulator
MAASQSLEAFSSRIEQLTLSAAILKGRHRNRIVIGYGSLSPAEIDDGVRRLRDVLLGPARRRRG